KRGLAGKEDWSYAGYGSNWTAMEKVLEAKFKQNSPLASRLLQTGNATLLEHCSRKGRDSFWSDDEDGSGCNYLGMLLMLQRDKLRLQENQAAVTPWTAWLTQHVDLKNGQHLAQAWRNHVRRATSRLKEALAGPRPQSCILPSKGPKGPKKEWRTTASSVTSKAEQVTEAAKICDAGRQDPIESQKGPEPQVAGVLSSRKSASPTKRRLSDVKEEPKSANANADGPHAPPVSPSLPSSDAEHNLPEEPEVAVAQTCQGDCQQVSRPEKDPGAPDPQDVEANDLEK
ncbi:unnamed protein product, partial [Symbiodinium pilosum]